MSEPTPREDELKVIDFIIMMMAVPKEGESPLTAEDRRERVMKRIKAYGNAKVLAAFDELEKQAGWYSQKFSNEARNDGTEDTLIPLSAITQLKQRYDKEIKL